MDLDDKWCKERLIISKKWSEEEKRNKEIKDILDMWKAIEPSYARLPESEKCKIKNLGQETKFRGFDRNDNGPDREDKYFFEASRIINKDESYAKFRGRYLNSHQKVLPDYRKMLEVYNTHKTDLTGRTLFVILIHSPIVPFNQDAVE